jgi:hypothetical protein
MNTEAWFFLLDGLSRGKILDSFFKINFLIVSIMEAEEIKPA